MTEILCAYASKHGSTREVAEAIGARLGDRGRTVDVRPADAVEDVSHYAAVVLGGSLYTGRWHADARRFLHRHARALAAKPLAVFAMGPATLDETDVRSSRGQLDHALARRSELRPFTIAIFGGVVDPAKLRFPFNRMPATDARDWDAIRAWADEIAAHMPTAAGAGAP
jgi:menaquinone-dependent protoporphyrinogen oxidase